MAELTDSLLFVLVSLSFMVVSLALAFRFGVEALIIWDGYKKGHIKVAPDDDEFWDEEDLH
jgi:hypothetical protein